MTFHLAWFGWLLMMYFSYRLGRKYQDFQDVMLARRVSKLIEQKQKVSAEREAWDEVTAAEAVLPTGSVHRAVKIRRLGVRK